MDNPAAPAPRVSVIVPAYGVAHLLGEALASLQAQSLAAWECIVIDDGAPDDVAGAVAPYLGDSRFRFLQTRNHGVSGARNLAIAEARAPLIALLDGDDLFRPDYLATMAGLLENDPTIRIATCNARIFGAVARERTCVSGRQGRGDGVRGSLADVLDRSFNVYIGTTFRRADFIAIGGFDESMAQSEDLDLWVRLLMLGGCAHYSDEVLGDYRVRPGSASGNAVRMLLGNVKVYDKAIAALCDQPEAQVAEAMRDSNRKALAFEYAVDRVIEGDVRRGLAELRAASGEVGGPVWKLAFAVWRVFPWLAAPMLGWRRRAHSRGAEQPGLLAALLGAG